MPFAAFVSVFLVAWVLPEDSLIQEMDAAHATVRDHGPSEQAALCDERVTLVVERYMKHRSEEQAVKYLLDAGFTVYKYNREGFQEIPDGVFKTYRNDSHKRGAIGDLVGESSYSATKMYKRYWQALFIFGGLEAYVGFDADGNELTNLQGRVCYQGL